MITFEGQTDAEIIIKMYKYIIHYAFASQYIVCIHELQTITNKISRFRK